MNVDDGQWGVVPEAEMRALRSRGVHRAGPLPDLDVLEPLFAGGDWPRIAEFTAALPRLSERRFVALARIGQAAVEDDRWLRAWRAERPDDGDLLAAYGEFLVQLAWAVRTADSADKVTRDQWHGFRRILRDVPGVTARAAALDPAPWLPLLSATRGLQWTNDEFRALWKDVGTRVQHSFTATYRGWAYWRPRWFGSAELMQRFLDDALADAPPGTILTMLRIEMLHDDLRPTAEADRTAFYHGPAWNSALDAGITDAAAADPDHVKLPFLRHWLAYGLWLADRPQQALDQFRALGPHVDADPWTRWNDPVAKVVATRNDCVKALTRAG